MIRYYVLSNFISINSECDSNLQLVRNVRCCKTVGPSAHPAYLPLTNDEVAPITEMAKLKMNATKSHGMPGLILDDVIVATSECLIQSADYRLQQKKCKYGTSSLATRLKKYRDEGSVIISNYDYIIHFRFSGNQASVLLVREDVPPQYFTLEISRDI